MKYWRLFFGLLVLPWTGCGSNGMQTPSRALVSISVQPGTGEATAPTGTVPFTATGTFNESPTTQTDLGVQWSSSVASIATIDASTGIATCVSAGGPITITASTDGKQGTAQLSCLSPPGSTKYTEKVLYSFSATQGSAAAVTLDTKGNLYGTSAPGVVFELSPPGGTGSSWKESVVQSISGANFYNPSLGLLTEVEGNLYGTSLFGGSYSCPVSPDAPADCGAVFELSPPASGTGPWSETVLYNFAGGTDSYSPNGGLTFDTAGNLYGTTNPVGFGSVGSDPYGVVFEVSPPVNSTGAWTQKVLYSFTGGADGGSPNGGLIFDTKGNLYGTTGSGGDLTGSCSPAGCGVVFRLNPPSGGAGPWTETVLYTFTGGTDGNTPNEGLIFDAKGNLYGTTNYGGNSGTCDGSGPSCGVVFELSPSVGATGRWTETVLYNFTGGTDGGWPRDGRLVFDSGGNLYGTAFIGGDQSVACAAGSGCGVVFRLSPPPSGAGRWTEAMIYIFTGGSDGGAPMSGLIFDSNGNLYGTASDGGDFQGIQGNGVVYQLSPD